MSVTQQNEELEQRRAFWLRKNRGVLVGLAREFGISEAMVGAVYWGRTNSGERRVERRLAGLGAPGFEEHAEKAGVTAA